MAKKQATKAEQIYMGRVAQLGCSVCRRIGFAGTPALVHHPRAGVGGGQRASHFDTIPMCLEHHVGKTGVHTLGTKGKFEAMYGFTEADLLNDTKNLLKGDSNV